MPQNPTDPNWGLERAAPAPVEGPRGRFEGDPDVTGLKPGVDPSAFDRWFETTLRPLLEQVAHPQTIADVAQLLNPLARSTKIGMTTGAAATAVGQTAGRGLATASNAVEEVANSRMGQYASAGGAIHGMFAGRPEEVAAAVAAPLVLRGAAKGLRALGRVLAGEPATMPELALAKAEFEAGRLPRPVYDAILRRSAPATAAGERTAPVALGEARPAAPLAESAPSVPPVTASPAGVAQAARAVPEPITLTTAEVARGLQYIRRGVPKEKVIERLLSERGFRERFTPRAGEVVETAATTQKPVSTASLNVGERVNVAHWREQGLSEAEIAKKLQANETMTAEFPVRETSHLETVRGAPSPQMSPAALEALAATGPEKLRLTAAEVSQGMQWLKAGVSPEVVVQRLTESRAFRQRFSLPTPESVRRDLATRDVRGRWE